MLICVCVIIIIDALIYVVDSADRERIDEAKEELAHVIHIISNQSIDRSIIS
jgi:hypothetical protein